MSDGLHGHGAILTLGGTAIGNIISIGGPDMSKDAIDKSTMDSTNKWREFFGGMKDGGEISLEINYDGTALGTANLLAAQMTETAQSVALVFPDGTNSTASSDFSFSGFLTALGHAIPLDDKVTQSVTIKVTGTPTYLDNSDS